MNRREWMKAGAAVLGLASASHGTQAGSEPEHTAIHSFHHDHILGTSLDLWFHTSDRAIAETAERAVLNEIERLRRVFSLFDSESELCKLNRADGPVRISEDLRVVLHAYERWQPRSGWACNAQVEALVRLWTQAEKVGEMPDSHVLADLTAAIRRPGWYLTDGDATVICTSPYPLNLNAAAKGYVIQRAVAVAKTTVTAGLVNLGGDLFGWGEVSWPVGVQHPHSPADNAAPLGGLRLRDQAVATSGGYQRFFTIGGSRYSHLIDPRTGQPAAGVASATVTASDSVTANLLATTLCVLGVDEGLRLVEAVPGVECLILTATGLTFSSRGMRFETAVRAAEEKISEENKSAGGAWPEGFQVTVPIQLPQINIARRYRRPYVAVWVEDTNGKPVRTLTVWGNSQKYLKDLTDWWKIARDDRTLVKAVTRATRSPGKYSLVWDGKDDKGKPVGQGTYTIRIEVHREHGAHRRQSGKIECGTDPATVTLAKNDESGESVVQYGGKKP
jgi:FAD:protein FMN transferase